MTATAEIPPGTRTETTADEQIVFVGGSIDRVEHDPRLPVPHGKDGERPPHDGD